MKSSPECIMTGRLATKGCVEYQFKVCGALTIVFIEVNLSLGTSTKRLNAVAQVIAEADGIPRSNSRSSFRAHFTDLFLHGATLRTVSSTSARPYMLAYATASVSNSSHSTAVRVPPPSRGVSSTPLTLLRSYRSPLRDGSKFWRRVRGRLIS